VTPRGVGGQIAVGTSRLVGRSAGAASTSVVMTAVPMMHEHVHQWARQQEEPRKVWDDVGTVLRNEKEPGDDRKQHEHLCHAPACRFFMRSVMFIHDCILANIDTDFTALEPVYPSSPAHPVW
jgi:hypothetical protein